MISGSIADQKSFVLFPTKVYFNNKGMWLYKWVNISSQQSRKLSTLAFRNFLCGTEKITKQLLNIHTWK